MMGAVVQFPTRRIVRVVEREPDYVPGTAYPDPPKPRFSILYFILGMIAGAL